MLVVGALIFAYLIGKAYGATPEQRTAQYFESIRNQPPREWAFLLHMPKGGDLHNHLSGAIYAESYVQWAAAKGLCVSRTTFVLHAQTQKSRCAAGDLPVSNALKDRVLYRQLINSWSMRYLADSGQNGHDHFFDAFKKFNLVTKGQTGEMLAEAVSRAAKGKVSYLELMVSPDDGLSMEIGKTIGWDGNFEGTLSKLEQANITNAVNRARKTLLDAEEKKDRLLGCGTPDADPGCTVTIRYIFQVLRAEPWERSLPRW
jgi:adenosine deaminase